MLWYIGNIIGLNQLLIDAILWTHMTTMRMATSVNMTGMHAAKMFTAPWANGKWNGTRTRRASVAVVTIAAWKSLCFEANHRKVVSAEIRMKMSCRTFLLFFNSFRDFPRMIRTNSVCGRWRNVRASDFDPLLPNDKSKIYRRDKKPPEKLLIFTCTKAKTHKEIFRPFRFSSINFSSWRQIEEIAFNFKK